MNTQLELDLGIEYKYMKGETCEICKGAEYKEMSLYDDWDGMVTCPCCHHRVPSKVRVK